jgi:hypothetical protein
MQSWAGYAGCAIDANSTSHLNHTACYLCPAASGAAAICDAIKHQSSLDTLKMGWCKLGGGEGAQAVADLLMFNTSLATVSLLFLSCVCEGAGRQTG